MIPNVSSARAVEQAINSVIPDIKLFFNHRLKRWVVAQIKANVGGLLLPDMGTMSSRSRPYTLFKIETKDGKYREPDRRDAIYGIQIGKQGREAIEKGGDWFVDQMEKKEAANKAAAKKRLHDNIAAAAPDIRKALRDNR